VDPEPREAVPAGEVPPIDEQAHVVDQAGSSPVAGHVAPAEPEAFPENPIESARAADAIPSETALGDGQLPVDLDGDAETAAMRAIEGGWTPRAAVAPKQPAPQPDLAPGEIEAAMLSARSAVASAAAAVRAATAPDADNHDVDRDMSDAFPATIDFESAATGDPQSFLDVAPSPSGPDELDFEPARPVGGFGRPRAFAEPRAGGADNLRQIRGITPDLEHALHRLGIYHYDQVAEWDHKAVVWLDHHLSLRGRIGREKWIDQARSLAGRRSAQRQVKP
jgi:hypothetical protein